MQTTHKVYAGLTAGLASLILGCCTDCGELICDSWANIPRGAIPKPVGEYTCAWQNAQAALAERDDFVIYRYEWVGDTAELGPFGIRHVGDLAFRLQSQPACLIIEPAEDTPLNSERRLVLVARLASQGIPDADSLVIIGDSVAEGLHGLEAPRLSRGYLREGTSGTTGNSSGMGAQSFGTSMGTRY